MTTTPRTTTPNPNAPDATSPDAKTSDAAPSRSGRARFLWVFPSTGDDEFLGRPLPERFPDASLVGTVLERLESHGFDGTLIPTGQLNNHFGPEAPYVDSLVAAGTAAAFGRRLELLVAVRPGLVHPAAAARALATVDRVSGGRVMLNLVVGGSPLARLGEELDRAQLFRRGEEFARVVAGLWEHGVWSYRGRHYEIDDAPCFPRPLRRPRPPIFVAGGSEDTIRLGVRCADAVLFFGRPLAEARAFVERLRHHSREAGRSPAAGTHFYLVARPTEAEALEAAERLVSRVDPELFAARRRFFPGARRRRPVAEPRRLEGHLWTHLERVSSVPTPLVVGSYDQVADTLARYRDLGLRHFVLQGFPIVEEIERVGGEVLPLLRAGDG